MEDFSELITRSQNGDKAAREALVEQNLGLVHHIVRRFVGRGCDAEDLFQIGSIGLLKAIDKFDTRLEVRFSTYAVPLIVGEIKRFLRDDGMVKVSRTVKENGWKIRAARSRLTNRLRREPTLEEIQAETGLSGEDVLLATEAMTEVESIYSAVYQDDGSEIYLVDRLAGTSGESGKVAGGFDQDPEKEKLMDRMLVRELLDSLEEGERRLIVMRYFQNKTQVEIAGLLGVSQVQVSRMEKRILLRLREKVL